MSLPPEPGQPHDPQQQPGGQVPPPQPPPSDTWQAGGQFQQPPPFDASQQSGQFAPGPPTGQFPAPGKQSLDSKLRSMPSRQLGVIAAAGGGGLLLFIIVVLVIVTSGGSPSDVADDYLSEIADADVEGAAEYRCDAKELEQDAEKMSDAELEELETVVKDMDWEIIDEDIEGDKATVLVEVTGSEKFVNELKLKLEERDGEWLICDGVSGF